MNTRIPIVIVRALLLAASAAAHAQRHRWFDANNSPCFGVHPAKILC